MRSSWKLFLGLALAFVTVYSGSVQAAPQKEWTFLVFINGNNSLDSYGAMNIKQMETVGSTQQLNFVVQWASEEGKFTKRMLLKKSTDPNNVTSPVDQELGIVDMGSPDSLLDFIKWGVASYPAKHYFVTVWNHGGGWHRNGNSLLRPLDISYDDITGHVITTAQLGQVMADAAKVIGHKVDIYGSDACMMGSAEVAAEMADSVNVFVGSEETEPGRGWPYDTIAQKWAAEPTASAARVASIVTDEYTQSYVTLADGEVTMSATNLDKIQALEKAIGQLANYVEKLSPADAKAFVAAVGKSQSFAYSDYIDLGDLAKNLLAARINGLPVDVIGSINDAIGSYVIDTKNTTQYAKATGVSLWIPTDSYTLDAYSAKYQALKFQAHTAWGTALQSVIKSNQ